MRKKEGTLQLPSFADLLQGRRQTWGDWFPCEIWQFHPMAITRQSTVFKALWIALLQFIFTLGVSRRGGLVFSWPRSKLNTKGSLPEFRLSPEAQGDPDILSCLIAWGSFCWTTPLAKVLVWICEVDLYWSKYAHSMTSESWNWKGGEPIRKEKSPQRLRMLLQLLRRPGGSSWMIWHTF